VAARGQSGFKCSGTLEKEGNVYTHKMPSNLTLGEEKQTKQQQNKQRETSRPCFFGCSHFNASFLWLRRHFSRCRRFSAKKSLLSFAMFLFVQGDQRQ
jgi:hypothetical protein